VNPANPWVAITRPVSPAIGRCELTHLSRVAIDAAVASAQHAEYERALERLGCSVRRMSAAPDMPDSVFVEDVAIVLDEIGIVTRPGAESRRPEVTAVAAALEEHRPLAWIEPPGTMDGGDVMVIGRTMFAGASSRTNYAGIEQLRRIVAPFRYEVRVAAVTGCLHLKSAVTAVNDETLLINQAWAPAGTFTGFDLVNVDPGEAAAANVVRVGNRLLYSAGFPRTRERLERRGFDVTAVDVSEIAKAEGAVTCCSVIFRKVES
jgi:dimethylargininase